MDAFVDQREYALLDQDRYTFFVLRRIIGGSCHTLLSNHENLIICYTGEPYPVWIWTADGAPAEILERANRLAAENGFLEKGQRFNIKYDLAEYMIHRSEEDGKGLSVSTNMFAYDCPAPVEPSIKVDGSLHRCTGEDLDVLMEFLDTFHQEIWIDRKDAAGYSHIGTSRPSSSGVCFCARTHISFTTFRVSGEACIHRRLLAMTISSSALTSQIILTGASCGAFVRSYSPCRSFRWLFT
jgi:hypothetical protein